MPLGRRLLQVAASLAAVAVVTIVTTAIVRVNPTTVGFIYLLTVLVIATQWGFLEAAAASLVATACFNFYFLPPVHTFTIADPQNWAALFTFLTTALIASQLSEREKRRRNEALTRGRDLEQLHSLSRAILLMDNSAPVGEQIARDLARVYELSAVAIYDRANGEVYRGGADEIPDALRMLREAALHGHIARDAAALLTLAPFTLGGQPIGSLALKGRTFSDAALQSLSNLVAIGLERARGREAASRAEAERHSEEFKSALLDAVAHEFKTPMTAIKAATSAILSDENSTLNEVRELSAIVDKEADRVLVLVSEAIHLARIEAGKMRLQKARFLLGSLVRGAITQMETVLEGRTFTFDLPEPSPEVVVDSELVQLVVRQLLDNALKYSPPSAPIRVSAESDGKTAILRVWNGGPEIPEWERRRIFEKFYRGSAASQGVAGTGMGLAIARQIMRAHGGDIHVDSGEGRGTEFTVVLPIRKEASA